ncbi:MAG TPA: glycosyltransferase family 2 protein [Verrucomicrobiae bacterium]
MYSPELVSVIMPAYNASRFVIEAIASVRSQTYPAWELLVVNDCSKDNTSALVRAQTELDPRVKLLEHQTNLGPAEARNTAVRAATGRYVAFLDSDDFWLPEKLERQLRFMQSTNTGLCYTQYRRITEDGSHVGQIVPVEPQITYKQLLKNTTIATSTTIVDRELTGPFSLVPGYGYDDFILWLDLLKRGVKAHALLEDLVRYRVVTGSVSRQRFRAAKWVWNIYRKTQGMGPIYSAWCLSGYAWRAFRKHRTLEKRD